MNSSTTLLWTNSNPTNDFNAKTINIDLSKYSSIIVDCRDKTSSSNIYSKILININDSGSYLIGRGGTTSDHSVRRLVTASHSGVTFNNAYIYSGEQCNSGAIPIHIYGINIIMN